MKTRKQALLVMITMLTALLPARGQSNSSSSPASLDAQVRAETTQFKGKVSLFARNLDSGESYSLNGDERVPTASAIKIAVMIETFARVAESRAKWTDELVLTKAARRSPRACRTTTPLRARPSHTKPAKTISARRLSSTPTQAATATSHPGPSHTAAEKRIATDC